MNALPMIAVRMLTSAKGRFVGMVFGVGFAALLMTNQAATFFGLMARTYGFISETRQPDVWVMDRKVQFVDDLKPMQDTELGRVRGVAGVAWAMPMYKGLIKARSADGGFQTCILVGVDAASLIGGPAQMVEGRLEDLRGADAVIVDSVSASAPKGKLCPRGPDGAPRDLAVGDTLELNDHRAVVVGLARCARTFQSQPMVYTTYTRALAYAPAERRKLSFVLVKAEDPADVPALCGRIAAATGTQALTRRGFEELTFWYFMKNTGIPFNFGVMILLGAVIGAVVCGLLFFGFIQDNVRHFGTLKAMGVGPARLVAMVLAQAGVVGLAGYGWGAGLTALLGTILGNKTELAFFLPWWVLAGAGAAVVLICLASALLGILRVLLLEPAIVFKS